MPIRAAALAKRALRFAGRASLAIPILLLLAWAFGALYYDGPARWLAFVQLLLAAGVLACVKPRWLKFGVFAAWWLAVLAWWLSLKPARDADWQPDVARTPWAEIDGDLVTLHNVRNCDYRTETDYTPRWETRRVDLSQLTGIDLAINYWGSPWMAHPIASFQFADAPPICFSIETRKRVGQSYSAIGGLYRQFALVYVAADERDVLRVRTNFRQGEDVFLYRLKLGRGQARERFLEYVAAMNGLRDRPRWYNAVTTNCTTSIRVQRPATGRAPWDWRMLVNGKGDEMLYERGVLTNDGLPFARLKERARINEAARAAGDALDFSARIRAGRPGMGAP